MTSGVALVVNRLRVFLHLRFWRRLGRRMPTATFGAAASQPTPGRRRSHGAGTTRAHGSDGDDGARALDASFGWGEDDAAPPTAGGSCPLLPGSLGGNWQPGGGPFPLPSGGAWESARGTPLGVFPGRHRHPHEELEEALGLRRRSRASTPRPPWWWGAISSSPTQLRFPLQGGSGHPP
jgi:hypothetical protein